MYWRIIGSGHRWEPCSAARGWERVSGLWAIGRNRRAGEHLKGKEQKKKKKKKENAITRMIPRETCNVSLAPLSLYFSQYPNRARKRVLREKIENRKSICNTGTQGDKRLPCTTRLFSEDNIHHGQVPSVTRTWRRTLQVKPVATIENTDRDMWSKSVPRYTH